MFCKKLQIACVFPYRIFLDFFPCVLQPIILKALPCWYTYTVHSTEGSAYRNHLSQGGRLLFGGLSQFGHVTDERGRGDGGHVDKGGEDEAGGGRGTQVVDQGGHLLLQELEEWKKKGSVYKGYRLNSRELTHCEVH